VAPGGHNRSSCRQSWASRASTTPRRSTSTSLASLLPATSSARSRLRPAPSAVRPAPFDVFVLPDTCLCRCGGWARDGCRVDRRGGEACREEGRVERVCCLIFTCCISLRVYYVLCILLVLLRPLCALRVGAAPPYHLHGLTPFARSHTATCESCSCLERYAFRDV
jgi:hypothetical protein